jgi:hypothetical protein
MMRWVPKGDFSKAISQGFMDSQRYGAGGLARSGEWYSAQSSIVEMFARQGGWRNTQAMGASAQTMQFMSQYGFAGAPGAQQAAAITGALPGMLGDPAKASFMMSVFGLTPMQMLSPGRADPTTGLNAIQTMQKNMGRFRMTAGSEFNATAIGQNLFGNGELLRRVYSGETNPEQAFKELLGDKSAEMKKDPVYTELGNQNKIQLEKMALSNDYLSEISQSTKIAALILGVRERLAGKGPESEAIKTFLGNFYKDMGDRLNQTIETTINIDGKPAAKAINRANRRTSTYIKGGNT